MQLTLVVFGLAALAAAMWSWNQDGEARPPEKVSPPAREPEKHGTE